MTGARAAGAVSRVLSRAGIPVGYTYNAFGYRTRAGDHAIEPGCQVTRLRRARYGGMEDVGNVNVFLMNPDGSEPPEEFHARVVGALEAHGFTLGAINRSAVAVLDTPTPKEAGRRG